jgi:hypothetical protein
MSNEMELERRHGRPRHECELAEDLHRCGRVKRMAVRTQSQRVPTRCMALLHSPMLCAVIGLRRHTEVGLNLGSDVDADCDVDKLCAEMA